MATIPDDELVDAVVARLQSVLPGVLEAAGLPAISEFLGYDPALLSEVKAPQIFVDLPDVARSSSEERGATLHKYSVFPQILVGVTSAGQDGAMAARRLRQTAFRIRQVLESDQTLGGRALWVAWRRTSYAPNIGKAVALYKIAFLTFDVCYRTQLGRE